ncbi:MAG: recombination regulator RecX [Oscillospiraceae bacterium]|jgi:regulatory protein|nr:recombination regulator RecX [Oscillospiraceae bacterium]
MTTKSERQAVLDRAAFLLGRRDHSTAELRRKLLHPRSPKVPIPEEATVDEALERLTDLGLLDDARFARELSRTLTERKGISPAVLRFELRRRGLEDGVVEDVLTEAEEMDPVARIEELLQTKFARKAADERGRRAAFAALLRLGYRHTDIRRAMRETGWPLPGEGM